MEGLLGQTDPRLEMQEVGGAVLSGQRSLGQQVPVSQASCQPPCLVLKPFHARRRRGLPIQEAHG